jgi:hypothetical protein
VSRPVWAMIELQRLAGMRPEEACLMRTIDINTSGSIWEYRPESHKTEHHGKDRIIPLGPLAQEVLKPWLRTELEAYLFSPREAVAERRAAMRAARKTKVQPSQQARRMKRPKRLPGERYTTVSYGHAIADACVRAFPHPTIAPLEVRDLSGPQRDEFRRLRKVLHSKDLPAERREEIKAAIGKLLLPPDQRAELEAWQKSHRWHPNQLRHSAATRIRREFGLETTKAVLGHSSVVPTQIYAEQDMEAARRAMERLG